MTANKAKKAKKRALLACGLILTLAMLTGSVIFFSDSRLNDDSDLRVVDDQPIPPADNLFAALSNIQYPKHAWSADTNEHRSIKFLLMKKSPIPKEIRIKLQEYLKLNTNVLQQIEQASQLGQFQHPKDSPKLTQTQTAATQTLILDLRRLNTVVGFGYIHLGKPDLALQSAGQSIRIANVLAPKSSTLLESMFVIRLSTSGYLVTTAALPLHNNLQSLVHYSKLLAQPYPAKQSLKSGIRNEYRWKADQFDSYKEKNLMSAALIRPNRTTNLLMDYTRRSLKFIDNPKSVWIDSPRWLEVIGGNWEGYRMILASFAGERALYPRILMQENNRRLTYLATMLRIHELQQGQLPPKLADLGLPASAIQKIDGKTILYSATERWLGAPPAKPNSLTSGVVVSF